MSKLTKIKSGGVILTLFLLGLFSGNAWGQEVVVFEEDFSELTDGGNTSNTGEGAPSGTAWNGNDNFPDVTSAYPAGETVKLGANSKGGTLTSKELDLSGNGGAFQVSFDVKGWTKNEGPIKVSLDGGATQTVEYSALIGDAFENVVLSFTGGTSASTLTFASQKRAFLDNIKISCQQSEVTQVATPVLTPRSTSFTDQLTVMATCATEGAAIYYTTDGTDPSTSTSSKVFPTEGLTLTETTTVKAMAANGELENSNVAVETYTKVTAMSIAEFKALENGAEGLLDLTGAVVTAVGSNDIFVQDAEGNGIDLYRSNQDWNVGDVLSGVASGTFALFRNMPEFSDGDYSGVTVTLNTSIEPKVVTIAELLTNPETYYCTLVKVEGVTCDGNTLAQSDNTLTCYDKFYVGYELPATANVTGVFIPYNTQLQICPRSEADVEDATGLEYPDFYWSMASVSVDINNLEAAVYPSLTNNSGGEVTYTSSNEDVATINAEGIVTIVGVGTTMIEASVAATATFNGATTAYELSVIDHPSALPEATAIVAENGGAYFAMTNTQGSTRLMAVQVNVVNGKVLATGDAIDWYVDYVAGTIQDANGMYVAHTGGSDIELSEESFAWKWDGSIWVSPNEADKALSYNPQITAFRAYDPENKSQKVAGPMPIVNGYTRTVAAGNYGTICLPYAVAAGDFAGVEFYSVAGKLMNGGQPSAIVLAPVTELEAGVPYIFSATDDQLLAAYSGDRAEAASANGLVGTFEYIDVEAGMYMISSANKVQLCGTGCTLGANRAYINMNEVPEMTEAAGANMRVISLDGNVTGIDGVEADGNQLVDVYTISGVRVRAQVPAAEATDGLQGGLYIVNGKKVAVK